MKTQAIVLLAIICLASVEGASFRKTNQARALTGEPTTSYEIRVWNMYAGRCEDKCPGGCHDQCEADKVFKEGIGMDSFCNDCQAYWNGSSYPRY